MDPRVGAIGEQVAMTFVVKHGHKTRETNYKKAFGEIDIITEKDGVLHFIEVKTSRYYPESAFYPEMRVNAKKIKKLKKICETYLKEGDVSREKRWQIDVISVILDHKDRPVSINYIENAVFEKPY